MLRNACAIWCARTGLLRVPNLRPGRAAGRNPAHDQRTGRAPGKRPTCCSANSCRQPLAPTVAAADPYPPNRGQSHAGANRADDRGQRIRHHRRNGSGRVRRLLRLAVRTSRGRACGRSKACSPCSRARWLGSPRLAVVAVAGAWTWVGWQSLRSWAWPAPSTLYVMGSATALTAVAMMWPRNSSRCLAACSWDEDKCGNGSPR